MGGNREFRLVRGGSAGQAGLQLLDPDFSEPLYNIDTNSSSDTVLIQGARATRPAGTVTANTSTGHASFVITGLKDVPSTVVRMIDEFRTLKKNRLAFDYKTPAFLEQRLEWKLWGDAPFWNQSGDPGRMKLVYSGTNNIIARFIHKSSAADLMEGTLIMLENHGPAWDATVLMSCLAVLKYASLMFRLKSKQGH